LSLVGLRKAARDRRTQALMKAAAVLSAEQRAKLNLRFVREWALQRRGTG
jgi:Spy/CpxP family protein refolding chaperone